MASFTGKKVGDVWRLLSGKSAWAETRKIGNVKNQDWDPGDFFWFSKTRF